MVIDKNKINELVDMESSIKIINLFPLLNFTDDFFMENIEINGKKFDLCKHETDLVISCEDGRIMYANANFMEEYNSFGRPKSLVGFKYKIGNGLLSVNSKLDCRWMKFGFYSDDVLDLDEMMKNVVCSIDDKSDKNINKYLFTKEEIDSIFKKVSKAAEISSLMDGEKKEPPFQKRYVKTID